MPIYALNDSTYLCMSQEEDADNFNFLQLFQPSIAPATRAHRSGKTVLECKNSGKTLATIVSPESLSRFLLNQKFFQSIAFHKSITTIATSVPVSIPPSTSVRVCPSISFNGLAEKRCSLKS